MRTTTYLFLVIGCLAAAHMAYAIGIGVTPSELKLDTTVDEQSSATLIIQNPSNEVALFEILPEEWEREIKISPQSFLLEAQGRQEVKVSIKPTRVGQYVTHLAITARPLGDETLSAAGGLRIPLQYTVRESQKPLTARLLDHLDVYGYFWGAALVLLGLGLQLTRRYLRG